MTYQGRSRRLCAVGCTLNLFPRPPKLLAAAGVSILACYGSRKPEAAPIVETASGLTAGELAGSKETPRYKRGRTLLRTRYCNGLHRLSAPFVPKADEQQSIFRVHRAR